MAQNPLQIKCNEIFFEFYSSDKISISNWNKNKENKYDTKPKLVF